MYAWRKMSDEERKAVLENRRVFERPLHGPPHNRSGGTYHIAAANYEHQIIMGATSDRLADFCERLLDVFQEVDASIHAWCVLPNHWHALLSLPDLQKIMEGIAHLHGKTSFTWNGLDDLRGRKCWHRCSDRKIRSEAHFFASRNYIHHNPVKHGYVEKLDDWRFSSVHEYFESEGKDRAAELWRTYPIKNMGEKWDR